MNLHNVAVRIALTQPLQERRDYGSESEVNIDFPAEELLSLKERLQDSKPIYTTRIMEEQGKYLPNQVLDSPLGKLKVKYVLMFFGIENHPFLKELTQNQKDLLGDNLMDLIELTPV